jgi:hypothetical protein
MLASLSRWEHRTWRKDSPEVCHAEGVKEMLKLCGMQPPGKDEAEVSKKLHQQVRLMDAECVCEG